MSNKFIQKNRRSCSDCRISWNHIHQKLNDNENQFIHFGCKNLYSDSRSGFNLDLCHKNQNARLGNSGISTKISFLWKCMICAHRSLKYTVPTVKLGNDPKFELTLALSSAISVTEVKSHESSFIHQLSAQFPSVKAAYNPSGFLISLVLFLQCLYRDISLMHYKIFSSIWKSK